MALAETPKAWKKGIQVCRLLGIKLSNREVNQDRPYVWDGKRLSLSAFNSGSVFGVSNFWHEIGHWLVALPEHRKLVEFGLGHGPETYIRIEPFVLDKDERDTYEFAASAVGCYLLVAFGYLEIFRGTAVEHGWAVERNEITNCLSITKTWLSKLDLEWVPPLSLSDFRKELHTTHRLFKRAVRQGPP